MAKKQLTLIVNRNVPQDETNIPQKKKPVNYSIPDASYRGMSTKVKLKNKRGFSGRLEE